MSTILLWVLFIPVYVLDRDFEQTVSALLLVPTASIGMIFILTMMFDNFRYMGKEGRWFWFAVICIAGGFGALIYFFKVFLKNKERRIRYKH